MTRPVTRLGIFEGKMGRAASKPMIGKADAGAGWSASIIPLLEAEENRLKSMYSFI